MRQIKFRAWDGRILHYSDNDFGSLEAFFGLTDDRGNGGFKTIYQQYTGLKDKNGKEIYEGDIVTTRHFDDWNDETGFDVVQVIKWCNLHVGWRGFTSKMLNNPKVAGNGLPNPITVIGNTFENTKLLK